MEEDYLLAQILADFLEQAEIEVIGPVGSLDEALALVENDPGSFVAAMGAARCAVETSDPRATIWASRAVELNPDDASARMMLSRLFASAGMKARARTELNALLGKNPDHKEAKALLRTL